MANLDTWWASLTIAQKERIAAKANHKPVHYPECTDWWVAQSKALQEKIHDHCVDSHGYLLKEWMEGDPYGD